MTKDDRIHARLLLRVYAKVAQHGKKGSDEEFELGGLRASSDFDGYTVTMTDGVSRASVFFHNSYRVDSPNALALDEFIERIERVDRRKYS